MVDFKLDEYYKPKGQNSSDKTVAQEDEKKNSDAEYAKMKFPCQGTYKQ